MSFFKNEKGISGIDVGIATIVIVLFVSIITTLFYQIYRVTTETKRKAEATAYISRIFENIQSLNYDDIIVQESTGEENKIVKILKEIGVTDINVDTASKQYLAKISGYTITLTIESYNEDIKKDSSLEDVIKRITAQVKYSINNNKQEQTLEMSTIITREK